MVQTACGKHAFSEIFELKASSAEGQSMLPREKKRKKRKVKA